MTLTAEQRAEISRKNAQKSTGPRTEAGKAVSRGNALKHGLTATTIFPVEAPGEPTGAFDARLDYWVADTQPRNVLELVMIQRACRASWKLDRCARYEDAAAANRQAVGKCSTDPNQAPLREEARHIGSYLMYVLSYRDAYNLGDETEGPRTPTPEIFDDAPRDADKLCSFKEGVEWLLNEWAVVLPGLPVPGGPPPEGSEEFLRRCRRRALRLLGVPTGSSAPVQPLREAGEAEIRRLRALHEEMSLKSSARLDADLALFSASDESQLLMRYEAQAERALHRAVNTFLKLRKDPDLVPAPEPAPEPQLAAEQTAAPAPRPATARSEPSPERNEPSVAGRRESSDAVSAPQKGRKGVKNGSP